jgi:Flp pilus assembly pilin Flp
MSRITTPVNFWELSRRPLVLYGDREVLIMKQLLRDLLREEQGQDLIEYTLLMAFVALASAALFLGSGQSISGIWSTSNSQLTYANSQAS